MAADLLAEQTAQADEGALRWGLLLRVAIDF